jgi:DNA polymerase (family X)
MVSNREIRQQFQIFSELLQVHETDEKLSQILAGAAYRLGRMPDQVTEMKPAELTRQFRPEVTSLIDELKKTNTIQALDELVQLTPAGIFEMMRIKGLGGKKLALLWKLAAIESIDTLLEACKNDTIKQLPGFGAKTQSNIIKAIEQLRLSEDNFHYASVADEANRIVTFLQRIFKDKLVSLSGEIRRKNNTVRQIELITAINLKKLISEKSLRKLLITNSSDENKITGHTINEIPFSIYHVNKENFFYSLFMFTGNDGHVSNVLKKLKGRIHFSSEEEIYSTAGMKYIDPEMREDTGEWNLNFHKKKQTLISQNHIKGVVHNHTTWSDGVDTLSDFVKACKNKKYEYVVISDHSKNAHYAGGLKEEKVLKQHKEIDALNAELAPFKVFKSIECDILVSGELDYGNDFLKKFDLVIVSVHQLLKMDREKATKRLIKAIENPMTTILGHMSGRQLLIRPGYPLDFKKIIDACAANKVIIEINANPYRLDVDWSHIPYILKKGVMISVNPDAHSIREIDNIRWGIESARKGGLTKEMTWNAMSLKQIQKWLKENRKF